MIKVCIIGLIVEVCLYVAALINVNVGGCDVGSISEEWENPKCEKLNGILAMAMWIVLAILIVCTIILGITH